MRKKHARGNGISRTPEYTAWRNAKTRCLLPTHPAYPNYGGRGITFYRAWVDDFQAFFEHIGPKPGKGYDIDRIDNSKGYEPGNVRWATRKENINNRARICPHCGGKL